MQSPEFKLEYPWGKGKENKKRALMSSENPPYFP
jgi:hypothetical protein